MFKLRKEKTVQQIEKELQTAKQAAEKAKEEENIPPAIPLLKLPTEPTIGMKPKKAWNFLKKHWKKSAFLYVDMELNNGMHQILVAIVEQGHFKFNGGVYLVSSGSFYWNHSLQSFMSYYREGVTLPIKIIIPVGEIREAMKKSIDSELIEYALDAKSLDTFLSTQTIRQMMEGASFNKILKTFMVLMFVFGFIIVTHFLLWLLTSGAIEKLQGAF